MKEVFDKISVLNKMIDEAKDEKYIHIFNSFKEILSELSIKVDEVISKQEYLEENLEYIDDDLTDIQEELFEEVDIEELDDEYMEIQCEHCGKPLFVEQKALNNNSNIPCPFCNGNAK